MNFSREIIDVTWNAKNIIENVAKWRIGNGPTIALARIQSSQNWYERYKSETDILLREEYRTQERPKILISRFTARILIRRGTTHLICLDNCHINSAISIIYRHLYQKISKRYLLVKSWRRFERYVFGTCLFDTCSLSIGPFIRTYSLQWELLYSNFFALIPFIYDDRIRWPC